MPSLFGKKHAPAPAPAVEETPTPAPALQSFILDRYVRAKPSAQNALDVFDDTWTSALPPRLSLKAGTLPTFNDTRIQALLQHLDSIKGFKVLELGPLEGGHTYMLHEAGASITAIEASTRSYLKCLVVKEILQLNRSHFRLGDFLPYLEDTHDWFDLVMASGVLYHTIDPLHLLELISKITDKIGIWTHFWDRDAVAADDKLAPMFVGGPHTVEWRGHTFSMHTREYPEAAAWTAFCGGPETTANWMEHDDILTALGELGYRVTVLEDDVNHSNGPAMLLCAERN
jgi:hypothetical protein